MSEGPNLEQVKNYFEERIQSHGATPRGVDWNSEAAQETRFAQLAKVIRPDAAFSLLDYGCGYGALADFLWRLGYPMEQYVGYDLLESMVQKASESHSEMQQCTFTDRFANLSPVDYTIVSGSFNVKLEASFEQWTDYVISELHKIDQLSRKGFAFNLLTKYSDAEHMRSYLYYADPCYMFDYCKRNFSRNVALLHDYEIYDFTIIVRKSAG